MSGLFEQQAKQDQRMIGALRELLGVDNAVKTIEKSNLEEFYKLLLAMAIRAREFESDADTRDAKSNLEETKRMLIDCSVNVFAVMQEQPSKPHEPGCKCDSCRAAASDVAHDEFVDAQLLKGAK